jgi:hypothetical protein
VNYPSKSTIKMKNRVIFLIAIATMLAGCSGFVGDMKYMNKLQDTLAKKYQTKNININITNGKYLAVSLVNSKFNECSRDEKQRVACEIGAIVIGTEKGPFSFESGHVQFVAKSSFLIFSSSHSEGFDMCLDSLLNKDTLNRKELTPEK